MRVLHGTIRFCGDSSGALVRVLRRAQNDLRALWGHVGIKAMHWGYNGPAKFQIRDIPDVHEGHCRNKDLDKQTFVFGELFFEDHVPKVEIYDWLLVPATKLILSAMLWDFRVPAGWSRGASNWKSGLGAFGAGCWKGWAGSLKRNVLEAIAACSKGVHAIRSTATAW